MINTTMRNYNYFTFGDTTNIYGQQTLSTEPKGTIRMAINIYSQSTTGNINYNNATYLALTRENIDDTYVIQYGEQKLKVLYVNDLGRLKQVYLSEYGN